MSDLDRQLLAGEVVAIGAALVAFVVTVVLIGEGYTREANPVARAAAGAIGWTAVGVAKLVLISLAFAVYRRARDRAPGRAVQLSALVFVGFAVVDALRNYAIFVELDLTIAPVVWTRLPILAAGVCGFLLLVGRSRGLKRITRDARGNIEVRQIGTILAVVLVLGSVLAIGSAGMAGNTATQVFSDSFEDEPADNGAPEDWKADPANGAGTIDVNTSWASDGTQSVYLMDTSDSGNHGIITDVSLEQSTGNLTYGVHPFDDDHTGFEMQIAARKDDTSGIANIRVQDGNEIQWYGSGGSWQDVSDENVSAETDTFFFDMWISDVDANTWGFCWADADDRVWHGCKNGLSNGGRDMGGGWNTLSVTVNQGSGFLDDVVLYTNTSEPTPVPTATASPAPADSGTYEQTFKLNDDTGLFPSSRSTMELYRWDGDQLDASDPIDSESGLPSTWTKVDSTGFNSENKATSTLVHNNTYLAQVHGPNGDVWELEFTAKDWWGEMSLTILSDLLNYETSTATFTGSTTATGDGSINSGGGGGGGGDGSTSEPSASLEVVDVAATSCVEFQYYDPTYETTTIDATITAPDGETLPVYREFDEPIGFYSGCVASTTENEDGSEDTSGTTNNSTDWTDDDTEIEYNATNETGSVIGSGELSIGQSSGPGVGAIGPVGSTAPTSSGEQFLLLGGMIAALLGLWVGGERFAPADESSLPVSPIFAAGAPVVLFLGFDFASGGRLTFAVARAIEQMGPVIVIVVLGVAVYLLAQWLRGRPIQITGGDQE